MLPDDEGPTLDLWLVTHPGTSLVDPITRPIVHRPFLCAAEAHTTANISFAELQYIVHEFLQARRPHWWLGPKTPMALHWRPCARPGYRLFFDSNCSAGEPSKVLIPNDAALRDVVASIRTRAVSPSPATEVVLTASSTWTVDEHRQEFWRQMRAAKRSQKKQSHSSARHTPASRDEPQPHSSSPSPATRDPSASKSVSVWDRLRSCRRTQCAYRCPASAHYEAHLAQLPSFDLRKMLLRRGTHMLMYGTSYLGQLSDAFICAATLEDRLLVAQSWDVASPLSPSWPTEDVRSPLPPPPLPPPSSNTPQSLQALPLLASSPRRHATYECCDGGVGEAARGGSLQTFYFTNNASLTVVVNHAALQATDLAQHHLEAFVRAGAPPIAVSVSSARHRFTHLVYMQPHPDCFFNANKPRHSRCVELDASSPSGSGTEPAGWNAEAPPLQWRILRQHIRHKLVSLGWKAWGLRQQHRFWNRSWEVAVRSGASGVLLPNAVTDHPCLMNGCDQRQPVALGGHQCLPGASTLLSLEIANAVRSLV